jgi:hypothetical protein
MIVNGQGTEMIKISLVLTLFALIAGGAVASLYSTQAEASQETFALPKGGKLSIAAWVDQTWPNFGGACLPRVGGEDGRADGETLKG